MHLNFIYFLLALMKLKKGKIFLLSWFYCQEQSVFITIAKYVKKNSNYYSFKHIEKQLQLLKRKKSLPMFTFSISHFRPLWPEACGRGMCRVTQALLLLSVGHFGSIRPHTEPAVSSSPTKLLVLELIWLMKRKLGPSWGSGA